MNQEQKSTETVLIANPNSCGGLTGKNWDILYDQIKEIIGENPEVAFSQKSGDGTTLTRNFLRKKFNKIVALGGDGTINEVANGFFEEISLGNSTGNDQTTPASPNLKPINSEAMMALVPCGTRNVLAKSLGLPEGIVECCKRFVNGKPQKIDVIAAVTATAASEPTHSNDNSKTVRIFLNAAEMGVGAEIIYRSKKIRDKIKSRLVSTVSSIIATLPTYESNLCNVSIDDGRQNILTKMTMGVVANGRYLGGGFQAAPHASISDGLLDITILKNSGSFKMLDGFVSMKSSADYKYEDDILYIQAKKVSINSKERAITVTVDGEPIGFLPGTFHVYQNALTLKF
jgi:diacylglycerol kinase (ATP)